MLNATCRLVVRQRSVAMDPWILDPQTAGETHKFLESTPLSFLRAGPPKFRRISAESRVHPNFDKKFAKLRQGPSYGPAVRNYARRTRAPPRESGAGLRDSVDAIVVCHESEITSK